jgi:hypothetical protein
MKVLPCFEISQRFEGSWSMKALPCFEILQGMIVFTVAFLAESGYCLEVEDGKVTRSEGCYQKFLGRLFRFEVPSYCVVFSTIDSS